MTDFRQILEDHVVLMGRGVTGPPIVEQTWHDPTTGVTQWTFREGPWIPPPLEILGRRVDLEAHYTSKQIAAMTADDYRKAFKCIEERKNA